MIEVNASVPNTSGYSNHLKARLSRIQPLFGRLLRVSALRDPASGRYEDPDAGGEFDAGEVDQVVRHEHHEFFEAWLCLSLEEQAADVAGYLWRHLENRDGALHEWRQKFQYMALVPSEALDAQRELFRANLEVVLNLLYFEAP